MPAKTKPTIRIRRHIEVRIPGLDERNQCGRLGQKTFKATVTALVRDLDDQGFVCDNFQVQPTVDAHFEDGRWEASCEQIAGTLIFIMHKLCGGRDIELTAEVSPVAEAGVTVEWRKGWAMPEFYAKRLSGVEKRVFRAHQTCGDRAITEGVPVA